jgi:tRNA (guanine-N7-)-methyltransferase
MTATSLPALLPVNILDPLDWGAVFGNGNPVALDLGAGDGGFAAAYAKLCPELNVLAVERLLGRVRKIARKAQRQELANLRVLRLESGYVVDRLCPPGSVNEMHLLFPDPWPKRRHWGRRLFQVPFLEIAARALKPGGKFRFVTDHPDYAAHAREVVPLVAATYEEIADEFPYPHTDFEAGFRAEGKAIHSVILRRR